MPPEKGPPGEATARRIRLKAGRVRGALATLAIVSSVPFHFDPAYTLPNAACRDPDLLAAEMTRIWHGDWVIVTTEDALSTRGDQLPVVIGRQPVLLARKQDGELAALSNLCARRGTLLAERPTNAKRIRCPYHGWTYTDAGELHAVPFAPTGRSFRRSWTRTAPEQARAAPVNAYGAGLGAGSRRRCSGSGARRSGPARRELETEFCRLVVVVHHQQRVHLFPRVRRDARRRYAPLAPAVVSRFVSWNHPEI